MATSTSKKDSRDSALNVHKFYGHQRHIDRSLHPVNQSVENFNDRDHRQIDGDHLAAVHSDRTGCLDIGEPDLSVQVDTDHTDDVVNGDHFSMVHIYRNAVECLNNFSNPQGGFCFSTPTVLIIHNSLVAAPRPPTRAVFVSQRQLIIHNSLVAAPHPPTRAVSVSHC